MKILSTPLGKHNGILDAAKDYLDVVEWIPGQPIYDYFDRIKPDVFMFDFKYIDRSFINVLKEYHYIKTVLFSDSIPQEVSPNLVCSKPSLSPLMKKHLENGDHKVFYLKDYGRILPKPNRNIKSNADIVYWSNHPPYSKYKDRLSFLSKISRFGKFKIIGPYVLPLPNYIGGITEEEIVGYLKSAKMVVDWDGENLLDYAANSIFCITTDPSGKLFPTTDLDGLNIKKYLEYGSCSKRFARHANKKIYKSKDNNFDRLKEILENLK